MANLDSEGCFRWLSLILSEFSESIEKTPKEGNFPSSVCWADLRILMLLHLPSASNPSELGSISFFFEQVFSNISIFSSSLPPSFFLSKISLFPLRGRLYVPRNPRDLIGRGQCQFMLPSWRLECLPISVESRIILFCSGSRDTWMCIWCTFDLMLFFSLGKGKTPPLYPDLKFESVSQPSGKIKSERQILASTLKSFFFYSKLHPGTIFHAESLRNFFIVFVLIY